MKTATFVVDAQLELSETELLDVKDTFNGAYETRSLLFGSHDIQQLVLAGNFGKNTRVLDEANDSSKDQIQLSITKKSRVSEQKLTEIPSA